MFLRIVSLIWIALLALQGCQPGQAQTHHNKSVRQTHEQVGTIEKNQLPREAHEVLRAIQLGGPFAYDRDGVVFGNFERVLPQQVRGYYHEYTVKTPGAHNRGARRIISGEPGEYYYSADHYQTFQRIQE